MTRPLHPRLRAFLDDARANPGSSRRLLLLGSSNTELGPHNLGHNCWGDHLAFSLRAHVGKHLLVINAGISGEITPDLHARFDRDVASLSPHAVLVTIGGNDQWHMTVPQYVASLDSLITRINALSALPILQTYYSEFDGLTGATLDSFTPYMTAKANLAADRDIPCIDSYPMLHAFHHRNPALYRALMLDGGHLNPTGHLLFATLASRHLRLPDPPVPQDLSPLFARSLAALTSHSASDA
jgi:lysophospholipase L1-like esterase